MLDRLPVLLLKELVLLPYQEIKLDLKVDLSQTVVDLAEELYGNKLLIVCLQDIKEESPELNDLPKIGVIGKIKRKVKLPNGDYRVFVTGLNRVQIKDYRQSLDNKDILEAIVKRLYIDNSIQEEDKAILKTLKAKVLEYMDNNPSVSNSVTATIDKIEDLDMLTDVITNFITFDIDKKIMYMNEFDYKVRAQQLIKDIQVELEVINIENSIDYRISEALDKEQRNYIIKQKIKLLNEELGTKFNKDTEVADYMEKINNLNASTRTKTKLIDEVKKYSYTSDANPDSSVIRNYLDTVLGLPWNTLSIDEKNIKNIKSSLDKSHYGMEEAKERIIEYIVIKKNSNIVKTPIICLVGPPGTGKTTLGMSIAASLNREFAKVSVGGLNDASELTGHKRTYLGSSPGIIMQSIAKCGTSNPVILIDEVDKMTKDYHGDPAAVLLDILDSSQNNQFIDHYIEEPFDLSQVLFILTANDLETIPSALKDRLEIINVSSYTVEEKLFIAKKYLIPLIYDEYNITKYKFSDEILKFIILNYTKEAGVRDLDRYIRKVIRKAYLSEHKGTSIKKEELLEYLGPVKYSSSIKENHVGCAITMGVTPYGGIPLTIESIFTSGNGNIQTTGNIEESVKESCIVAYNYLLSHLDIFKIKEDNINNKDIHINMHNYSVKKAGTSGGLACTVALLSLLLDKKIDDKVCFTGEIDLNGDILKVGGIKEKVIGAYNEGFKTIFIPKDNKTDVNQIPTKIQSSINIICVSTFEEVYKHLFKKHK